ncbi:MAG: MBL fold metallo-hydrolase [Chloroflexi bacterium]|nr:MBL fold metallo-hydrolase [Chloroflexota bacterium]
MEIVPGVHLVDGVRWSRVYLVEGETLALVDSGLPWSPRGVMRHIAAIGRKPQELKLILMTHCHPDHTSGAMSISRLTGAQIVAHSLDTKTHARGQVSLCYMGVFSSMRTPLPFLRRAPVTHLVADGDAVPAFEDIRVVHTPGHTRGSVCYLWESKKLLFSGDTLFSDGSRVSRSVPFPGYDGQAYQASLNRLAGMEFETLCGGHGVPLKEGASERLRELLKARPNPPRWGDFLKSIPKRLHNHASLTGEHSS